MDIGASNWNEADASNSTASPDGAPEGMAPSGVNDTIRAMMGASKRWYNWSIPKTTAGTATAYTLTYSVAPGALVDGMTFMVQFHAINGAAATLDINLLGAKPLHYHAAGVWRVAPPGLLDTDEVFRVAYHDGTGAYRLVGFRNGTGKGEDFWGSTPPAGTLLCNGQAVSRTDFAGLFAVIGTTFGAGNGTTTFNVPDARGRDTKMVDGGTGRLPGFGSLGAAGGQANQIFAVSGSASGNVNINANTGGDFGGVIQVQVAVGGFAANTGHQHNLIASVPTTLTVSGVTDTRSVVNPTIACNKVIRI